MARTYQNLQDEVLVRLGSDTTSSFYSESYIRTWLNSSHLWACGYHKWPQTEYKDSSSAFTTGTETYSYPNSTFRTDSIRILQVGSYLFKKKNFADYLKFREDYPDRTDNIFSDYGRMLYINPNCSSGTIYAYAQYTPADMTRTTDSTVFSNSESEVDEAIIEKTLSLAYQKALKFNESTLYEKIAKDKLEEAWTRIKDEQAMYQTIDHPMFTWFPIIGNNQNESPDNNNPLQF